MVLLLFLVTILTLQPDYHLNKKRQRFGKVFVRNNHYISQLPYKSSKGNLLPIFLQNQAEVALFLILPIKARSVIESTIIMEIT